MTSRSSWDSPPQNVDVSWESFDPAAYVDHNYRCLHAEDAEILRFVRDHFADHFRVGPSGPVSGIDVGAGPNLYPALAMLPWCDEITLLDRSPANVRYLERQLPSYDAAWDQFWEVLCEHQAYRSLGSDPRERFRRIAVARQGDLFDLARYPGRWTMGTMFFVAESMTGRHAEFQAGVEHFMCALAPGAPFAAAFMAHSRGYSVGGNFFPACDVGESDVWASLEEFAQDFKIVRLTSSAAIRAGYSGIVLACGWRRQGDAVPPGP
ncbi:SCO2525 family SAM-dependent methyltransferase [Streptomyces massasporeus]|uniref:SCO2525 family SAM-dependent methyltransferase n=1 Tax=Streptomyces massasporeus TaxID=67324 RepID=UPI0036F8688E